MHVCVCMEACVVCVVYASLCSLSLPSLFVRQVSEVWKTYELDLISYQNKCRLIRGWDDLFNKVKEHINSVAAMKLSPYYKVSTCTTANS